MIRSQRRIHRMVFLVLAVLIPAVLAAAWLARRPPATMDRIPAALKAEVKP